MNEEKLIMKFILEKLSNMDKWGGCHTELNRVKKALPLHLFGKQNKKYIDKAIKQLINLRFLLAKPSTGEIHISLNPKKKKEIYEFIERHEKDDYKF